MSYSSVTHVGHDQYSDYPRPPPGGGYFGGAPPPPPRPGFEQGYGPGPAGGPGYQSYFSDNYRPPQVAHVHHSGPAFPFHDHQQQPYGRSYDYSYDTGFSSPFKSCLAALCCCCCLEQCCNIW